MNHLWSDIVPDQAKLETEVLESPLTLEIDVMHEFQAGTISFGVIFRQFTEAAMLKYEGRPGIAELLKKIREEGFFDQGVSIYVNEAVTKRDYLRFDCFEREPHYHYHHLYALKDQGVDIEMDIQRISGYADSVVMNGYWHQLPFDAASNGDIRTWALDRLRNRLEPMLRAAGADALADSIDTAAVAAALDELEPYVYAKGPSLVQ